MWRLTIKYGRKEHPIVASLGVRSYHLRVVLDQRIPISHVARALAMLDGVVIIALGLDLYPEYDGSHLMRYDDPGRKVEAVWLAQHCMTNPFDPEEDLQFKLPEGVGWRSRYMERHVQSWEHISFWDVGRLPVEQLRLTEQLCRIEGLVNVTVHPMGKDGELWLQKGLAWRWDRIKPLLDSIGINGSSRLKESVTYI